MLKNGVAIQRSRHHWFSGLRPAADGKIPTTHFRGQAQVTLLSTLQRSAGSGAKDDVRQEIGERLWHGAAEWVGPSALNSCGCRKPRPLA